jgi:four helix bundle protein
MSADADFAALGKRFRRRNFEPNSPRARKQARKAPIGSGPAVAGSTAMSGFKDFREIAAWQRSREVKILAYTLLAKPEVARDFKFRDQLRDAARSAPRNIAEGFARYKHKEFAQFVRVAKGSLGEVLDHFIDAVDSGYLTPAEFTGHEHACKKALKAVNGLIRYLESTPDPPRKPKKPP